MKQAKLLFLLIAALVFAPDCRSRIRLMSSIENSDEVGGISRGK